MAAARHFAVAAVAVSLALAACPRAAPAAGLGPLPHGHVPGQVVVRFHAGATAAQRRAARRAVGARVGRRLALHGAQRLELPAVTTVKGAVATLGALPGVRYAEPNVYAAEQACPATSGAPAAPASATPSSPATPPPSRRSTSTPAISTTR